jgi:predicted HAD superfamily Cof-like phosphohydrolase
MTDIVNNTVLDDQERFMAACGQTTFEENMNQFFLYIDLIKEELAELEQAVGDQNKTEQLDALLDIMVVCAGALLSRKWDCHGGWAEVVRSNMAKVDPVTGKVIKRADGKILKPEGWTPPQLAQFTK